MVKQVTITKEDVARGKVQHYSDYLRIKRRPSFKVVIPTLDRPDELCRTTLAFEAMEFRF